MSNSSIGGGLGAALAVLAANSAAPVRAKMDVLFRGHQVGTNSYEMKSNGEFTSVTDMDLLGSNVHSSISGRFSFGQLVSYRMYQTMPTQTVSATLAKNRVDVEAGGKRHRVDLKDAVWACCDDFHPQLAATILHSLGSQVAANVSTFVPSDGTSHAYRIATMQPSTATVGRYRVTFTPYSVTAERVTLWLAVGDKGQLLGLRVGDDGLQFVLAGYEGLFGGS